MSDVTLPDGRLLVGDCRARLAEMDAGSVHLVVCSPPYWGLRRYSGVEPSAWDGDPKCAHVWNDPEEKSIPYVGDRGASTLHGGPLGVRQHLGETRAIVTRSQFCRLCGCWIGCLGNEPDLSMFVAHLVEVFAAVKRVLREDGVMVVNLGDSYAGSGKGPTGHNGLGDQEQRQGFTGGHVRSNNGTGATTQSGGTRKLRALHDQDVTLNRQHCSRGVRMGSVHGDSGHTSGVTTPGFKAKSLLGVPFRVALALHADGWIWRSCMPWVKFGSAMPESTQDRPTSAIEYVFLFAKSQRYYWDQTAVRRDSSSPEQDAHNQRYAKPYAAFDDRAATTGQPGNVNNVGLHSRPGTGGRSMRNSDPILDSLDAQIRHHHTELMRLEKLRHDGGLMTDEDGEPLALLVNPEAQQSNKQGVDHYASYPRDLVRPFVLAGTSERGVCACGAPWERVTKTQHVRGGGGGPPSKIGDARRDPGTRTDLPTVRLTRVDTTLGWRPTCTCPAALPIPAVVLDPFLGSGTTAIVARELGRHFIGIDASAEYVALAARRLAGVTVGALAASESVPTLTQMGIEDAG